MAIRRVRVPRIDLDKSESKEHFIAGEWILPLPKVATPEQISAAKDYMRDAVGQLVDKTGTPYSATTRVRVSRAGCDGKRIHGFRTHDSEIVRPIT